MSNFKTVLYSFAITLVALGGLATLADWLHPRLPCLDIEKNFWREHPEPYVFERVSSFYWSSLCRPEPRPIIISASEGTGELSFPELALALGFTADEFSDAHRGFKTLSYILANEIHPERRKNMRVIAMINPVYFSFAASTDRASISLLAISNFSYLLRVPHPRQKWDEFLPESIYIGAKNYFTELSSFWHPSPARLTPPPSPPEPVAAADYNFERHILKEVEGLYTSFRSPFTSSRQPARAMFDRVRDFAHKHPDTRICYVMLPHNAKNRDFFQSDAARVTREMSELMRELPEHQRLDLQNLNEEPFIFRDPMHLTDYGKQRILKAIMASDCAQNAVLDQ